MVKKWQKHIFHYRIKWGLPLFEKLNKWRSKKRILLYTDSRGTNIPKHFYYTHYSEKLARKYSIETHLVPHKWTTLIDFLDAYKHNPVWQNDFDLIILHLGIVDFAPRQKSTLNERIYPDKKEKIDRLFGENRYKEHLKKDLGVEYEGELTTNLFSLEMAERYVLPELKNIPNLLWIGGNGFIPNWRGNYWRDRPANIAAIEEYFKLFEKQLPFTINFLDWSEKEIKENTYDIVHLNEKGSNLLLEVLKRKLDYYFSQNS